MEQAIEEAYKGEMERDKSETGAWEIQRSKHSRRRSKQHAPPREQGIDEAYKGEMGGCSERNNKTVAWEQGIEEAYKGEMGGCSEQNNKTVAWEKQRTKHSRRHFKQRARPRRPMLSNIGFARIALKYYEKKHDGEFEIVKVDFVKHMEDAYPKEDYPNAEPGPEGTDGWCHVGFTAKLRNANWSDASMKHFFGELKLDDAKFQFIATYCSIVDPIRGLLYRSGQCMFCPGSVAALHPTNSEWACIWCYGAGDSSSDSD